MDYIHIPVPFDSPNIDHLRKLIKIMTTYSEHKVWVHCVVNWRVSAFLYQYISLELGRNAAKIALHPTWDPDKIWEEFISISPSEILK